MNSGIWHHAFGCSEGPSNLHGKQIPERPARRACLREAGAPAVQAQGVDPEVPHIHAPSTRCHRE